MAAQGQQIVGTIVESNNSVFTQATALMQLLHGPGSDEEKIRVVTQAFDRYRNTRELLELARFAADLANKEFWDTHYGKFQDSHQHPSYGVDIDGEPLHIARANINGAWHPGKVGRHIGVAHIPMDDKEILVDYYQVLCIPTRYYEWRNIDDLTLDDLSRQCVIGGTERNGQPLYVARAFMDPNNVTFPKRFRNAPPGVKQIGKFARHLNKLHQHFYRAVNPDKDFLNVWQGAPWDPPRLPSEQPGPTEKWQRPIMQGCAHVGFGGEAFSFDEFELLLFKPGFEWLQQSKELQGILKKLTALQEKI
ncbi:hypothetical protein HK104_003233 [Borealophlyctis nickersoniae]|nr:hypothetical protein HK104_003233 [Borealophlyctis nickersoniae]